MACEDRYKEFERYIRATESEQKEKADAWQVAIACRDGVG